MSMMVTMETKKATCTEVLVKLSGKLNVRTLEREKMAFDGGPVALPRKIGNPKHPGRA